MGTTEARIKQKVISILKEFRGFSLITSDEVKIVNLEKQGTNYITKGNYVHTTLFGGRILEEGEFEITLAETNLEPVGIKITPKS
ncbi:MAG: hypothetical protein ACRDFB_02050 [Rhabdochlamydiaceae bacterium]